MLCRSMVFIDLFPHPILLRECMTSVTSNDFWIIFLNINILKDLSNEDNHNKCKHMPSFQNFKATEPN